MTTTPATLAAPTDLSEWQIWCHGGRTHMRILDAKGQGIEWSIDTPKARAFFCGGLKATEPITRPLWRVLLDKIGAHRRG